MNKAKKYLGLFKSSWFWGNLLFVLLCGMFIPFGFFAVLVAIGFNMLRGKLGWATELSIWQSTAGYIIGLALYFASVVIFRR